jgi:hypothetical protein
VRWHYRDPPLVWLFLATYAAHVVEEWFGGFPEWFAVVAGRPLSREAFLVINALAFAAMAAAIRAAIRREALGWLAIAIATVVLINGAAHLLASLVTRTYSPGLLTGVILYLPLAQLALLRAWHQVSPSLFWRGIAAGVAAHAVVTTTALAVAYSA